MVRSWSSRFHVIYLCCYVTCFMVWIKQHWRVWKRFFLSKIVVSYYLLGRKNTLAVERYFLVYRSNRIKNWFYSRNISTPIGCLVQSWVNKTPDGCRNILWVKSIFYSIGSVYQKIPFYSFIERSWWIFINFYQYTL